MSRLKARVFSSWRQEKSERFKCEKDLMQERNSVAGFEFGGGMYKRPGSSLQEVRVNPQMMSSKKKVTLVPELQGSGRTLAEDSLLSPYNTQVRLAASF